MRIGIFGHGKLGTAVAALAARDRDIDLAWIVDKGEPPGSKVDVALDASAANAVAGHLEWASSTGTDFVIGTTGWDKAILEGYREAGIGILVSANFSLAVAFMRRAAVAIGRLAALDAEVDLAVVERHHKHKADAPSGTAKLLAAALAEGCPRYDGWVLGAAQEGKVSVSSLRSGAEIGFHEIRLEAAAETLSLAHEAKTRELFAAGALRAMLWIRGRKGLHRFDELAAELIDPMFAKGEQ